MIKLEELKRVPVLDNVAIRDKDSELYALLRQYAMEMEWGNDAGHPFDVSDDWYDEDDEDSTGIKLVRALEARGFPTGTEIMIYYWW